MTEWMETLRRPGAWLPLMVFLSIACWLYLPDVLFRDPAGFHFVRQTDSYSFSQRYGHPSWNLFTPAVHDLRSCPDNGAASAEFPLLYYVDALLREVFGLKFSLLRVMGLSFVLVGHVLLARLAARWLGSPVSGTAFSLWMFSSSIVVYYGANYLPDAAVYGCVLIGACVAVHAFLDEGRWFSVPAILFLTLAGLLKAPASMYLLAYLIAGLHLVRKHKVTGGGWRSAGALATGSLMIIGWHAYAIRYNAAHHTMYFMTWAEPLWSMSALEAANTWGYVWYYWWPKYHHPTTWHVLSVISLLVLISIRRLSLPARTVLSLLIMAALGFIILFFRKLRDHDYYFLTIAPVVIAVALTGSASLHDRLKGRWQAVLPLAFITFAIMGLVLAQLNLTKRHNTAKDMFNAALRIGAGVEHELDSLGVPRSARFIVSGDPTPNGGLSLIDREGWPFADTEVVDVPSLIALGADHLLIIGDRSQVDTTAFETILSRKEVRLMRLVHH